MRYLFFDTETTGLPKSYRAPVWFLSNWPRVVQVGWQLTDGSGSEINSGCRTIKPGGFAFDERAIALHGITPELAALEGGQLKNVLSEFCEDLKRADVVVAHNIQFDTMILRAEFIRNWSRNHFRGRQQRCTMREATEFCGLPRNPQKAGDDSKTPKLKWPSLTELHAILFDCGVEQHHNALADSRACSKCFWELKRRGVI